MEGYEEIKTLLEECNQSHILDYWEELSVNQQREFLKQIKSINFKDVNKIWEKVQDVNNDKIETENISPIEVEVASNYSRDILESYRTIGLEEIANSKVAVIVLAGGQGTRLGMSYPKGMCPTGIPSGKTLFQLQAERIRKLQEISKEKTGKEGVIYWYLMTSEATDTLTAKFIEQSEYFNLKKENVKLFKQGQIPCFNWEGKILLEEKDSVAMAPDGNGGIYKALRQNGILDDMEKKGIKYVHLHSVDNILIKIADPVFIGKCVKDQIDCGLKVVKKTDPSEPLGIVVKINNEPRIVEYSEIPQDIEKIEETSSNDGLRFNSGNICNHFFTVDFLKLIAHQHEDSLKMHKAKKVVIQIGPEGDKICPTKPNCIKVEKFIFDVICYSKKFLAWQVERSEEFSPVKNNDLTKKDCFSTAKTGLLTLHKTWIENMGGCCKGLGVEISPLVSYDGEGLEFVKGREYKECEIISSEQENQNT